MMLKLWTDPAANDRSELRYLDGTHPELAGLLMASGFVKGNRAGELSDLEKAVFFDLGIDLSSTAFEVFESQGVGFEFECFARAGV